MKVHLSSPAGLQEGRSVGSTRLYFFPPRCARRVGRSGWVDSDPSAPRPLRGPVGRVYPTQFFPRCAARGGSVGRGFCGFTAVYPFLKEHSKLTSHTTLALVLTKHTRKTHSRAPEPYPTFGPHTRPRAGNAYSWALHLVAESRATLLRVGVVQGFLVKFELELVGGLLLIGRVESNAAAAAATSTLMATSACASTATATLGRRGLGGRTRRALLGSVGRAAPTRTAAPLARPVGRSVGSTRPKKFSPRCARRVGRSVFTESETQKSHFLGRSVGDAERTINFAPPIRLTAVQKLAYHPR